MPADVLEYIDVDSEYELERNKPMPSQNHAVIQMLLGHFLLKKYISDYSILSEVKLKMPEKPDLVPDLCIYNKIQINFQQDLLMKDEMPITAIEILSPRQSTDEIISKIARYFQAGVKSCWMVLPAMEAICVYTSLDHYNFFDATQILVDPVTQFSIDLKEVFQQYI